MIRDSEFGGMRIRAFGTYTVRVTDATKYIREIVGTDGVFTTDEISDQLRNLITSRFATIVVVSGLNLASTALNLPKCWSRTFHCHRMYPKRSTNAPAWVSPETWTTTSNTRLVSPWRPLPRILVVAHPKA